MEPPKEYWGPVGLPVPPNYVDVTIFTDTKRHGIPNTVTHPYYVLRNKIHPVVTSWMHGLIAMRDIDDLVDRIMESIG